MDQNMGVRLVKWLSIIVLSVAGSAALAEGDAAAGHKKNHSCTGCHGIPGWRTAFPEVYKVPKLGGQHAAYIIAALKGYKSGERKHGTMQAIAATLTEQDMADLAAYYATMAAK
jgi:cytochrome c553